MLFGGGSKTWVREAMDVLARRPDVLACNPLPGPPTADGTLRSQVLERDPMGPSAFRSSALSTRLFLMDLGRIPVLTTSRVTGRPAWHARIEGNPNFNTLENTVSESMAGRGLIRLDFLGAEPGVWAVHPPWRSATFYQRLPDLVDEIERGGYPNNSVVVTRSGLHGRLDRCSSVYPSSDRPPFASSTRAPIRPYRGEGTTSRELVR